MPGRRRGVGELFEGVIPHVPFFLVKQRIRDHETPLTGVQSYHGAILHLRTEGVEPLLQDSLAAGVAAARGACARLLPLYTRIIEGAVCRHEGSVLHATGADLVAFFPARGIRPTSLRSPDTFLEDLRWSAERAISAAAWMHRNVKSASDTPRVRLRAGIAAGPVWFITFPIRGARRIGWLLYGETAREAAGMAGQAPAHGTVVALPTFQVLGPDVAGARLPFGGVRLTRVRHAVKPGTRVMPRGCDLAPDWLEQTLGYLTPLLPASRMDAIASGSSPVARILRGAVVVSLRVGSLDTGAAGLHQVLGRTVGAAIRRAEEEGAVPVDPRWGPSGCTLNLVFPPGGGRRGAGRRALLLARRLSALMSAARPVARLHAGLAGGDVLLAQIGSPERRLLTAEGEAVRRAMSLALQAPAGEAWGDGELRGAATPPVRLVPVEEDLRARRGGPAAPSACACRVL